MRGQSAKVNERSDGMSTKRKVDNENSFDEQKTMSYMFSCRLLSCHLITGTKCRYWMPEAGFSKCRIIPTKCGSTQKAEIKTYIRKSQERNQNQKDHHWESWPHWRHTTFRHWAWEHRGWYSHSDETSHSGGTGRTRLVSLWCSETVVIILSSILKCRPNKWPI